MKRRWSGFSLLALTVAAAALAEEEAMSAEQPTLRLVTLAEDFDEPWGLAVLPGELYLITERSGRIVSVFNGERQEVGGLPSLYANDAGGLHDIIASPDFPDTGWLYFTYASGDADATATSLARGRLAGDQLTDVEELFKENRPSEPGRRHGSRLAWLQDDSLLMSVGDRGDPERAQDTEDHAGSILRMDPAGLALEDNPLFHEAGHLPRLYSWGHREVQGIATDPESGDVWVVEARPSGNDELNRIEPGENHGWPELTLGEDAGSRGILEEIASTDESLVKPVHRFDGSIDPTGLALIRGERYPQWEGNLIVGGQESETLYRVEVSGDEVDVEPLLSESIGPVRDVRLGPDGYLYILTGGSDAALHRLEPAE
ncbi:PQQ-dependent sugar dehydrogenase [Billgrantia pellis]|uniref:PQQ-dependent sugar dehydrogenase n=1 Tax=Billgrantia pellis TaxID=2606936 RepID=A0A7V7FWH8_9GAMM|nr:PQQ-dependent sugar dehydrogenase [Halomonas pellis]KAA0009672.1 PQQ-dependent sugar dehydrogenase [Halomonas pellis]